MEVQSVTDSLPDRLIHPAEYEPMLLTSKEHTHTHTNLLNRLLLCSKLNVVNMEKENWNMSVIRVIMHSALFVHDAVFTYINFIP